MPRYQVPPNTGKVRVAMSVGGTYAVWNGKQGKNEFKILVRSREKAEALARQINTKQHEGFVDVYD